VDVVAGQQEEEAEASGKRKASSEAGSTPQEDERHATLSFVTTTINEQLFNELMQGFHLPRYESEMVAPSGGEASDSEDDDDSI
jgi:hypothetical protein